MVIIWVVLILKTREKGTVESSVREIKKCDGDILLRFTPKNPFFEIVSKKSTRNEYAWTYIEFPKVAFLRPLF